MDELEVILVGETPSSEPPQPGLEGIWRDVTAVLRHYAWFNKDAARIRSLQHAILTEQAFLAPSLHGHGGDLCRRSYAFRNLVFYHFSSDDDEEYFWITSQLDRCFAPGALYLPALRKAFALYPHTLSSELLFDFEEYRSGLRRSSIPAASAAPVLVVGHFHMIHHLWNELSALDRAIAAGLTDQMRVVTLFQPLGALDQIFPELAGRVEPISSDSLTTLHEDHELLMRLGDWSIPVSTRTRVIEVARRSVPTSVLAEQHRFATNHGPVFWLSVKPPQRSCEDQVEAISALIQGFCKRYPSAGFLLEGVSFPFDYSTNSNYPDWFRDVLEQACLQTEVIAKEIVAGMSSKKGRLRLLSRLPVQEEIVWASLADFYVCHGGSMQNKIGWLHDTPGVVHSNTKFMAYAREMQPPVEQGTVPCYLPDELVIDDDPTKYTALELARKDQNYRFNSISDFVDFVLTKSEEADYQCFERAVRAHSAEP